MFASVSRASLLALVVGAMCFPSTSNAAEVAPSPRVVPFTAFPNLKAYEPAEDRWFVLPELPPNASPLRKVRHAQATAAFLYLAKLHEVVRNGWWRAENLLDTVLMTREAYRLAANVEEVLANRLPWYEERVRAMKSLERFIEERIQRRVQPPNSLNLTRFFRYEAEADLLRLRDEVARSGNTTSRPLVAKSLEAFLRDTKSPMYTAFPALITPLEPTGPPKVTHFVEKKDDPWAGLPELDASASPLRRTQFARASAGLAYRFRVGEVIRIGTWSSNPSVYCNLLRILAEPCYAVTELEPLGNRVHWYEQAVVITKYNEQLIKRRADFGTVPLHDVDFFIHFRLEAEAKLLQLQDEIAKNGAKPTPPGKRTPFVLDEERSPVTVNTPYTAFPELRSPTFESREVKDPNGFTRRSYAEKDSALFPLPVLAANDSQLRKVLLAQVRDGLAYLAYMKEIISIGSWNEAYFPDYLRMTNDVFRAAAELEPAKRTVWHEARVQRLKSVEYFMLMRVKNGTSPPQDLNMASFVRLQGEIDLLKFKAEVEPVKAPLALPLCQPVYCPPRCVCPRPRVFPRLFRR